MNWLEVRHSEVASLDTPWIREYSTAKRISGVARLEMEDPLVTEHDAYLQRRFRGIISPLVTPLIDRDTLDEPGLQRLVEHVIAGGVRGIFILGSTGEAPSLSYRLRCELIVTTCQLVHHRVPVLVGITDTAFVESLKVAKAAAEAQADALVLSTPYYFPAGQTELTRYVQHLTRELPLPLMLYNMPSLTKVSFEIDTLRRLSEIGTIVGVKDSSGDLEYFAGLVALRKLRPDWSILIGPEHLLCAAIQLGGDGGVCGGSNVLPRLFSECYEATVSGDMARAEQLIQQIHAFQDIYTVGKYASRFIKATKSALSLLGICSDFMAEPFNHFLPPQRQQVRAILQRFVADDAMGA
jgi:dihydrodipicolinate synthase/N-acetylneuraminate lyase